jgi:hypothetical protein
VSRRRAVRPPDLTSLFDVLFLFVFVSLVNAGVTRKEADQAIAAAAPKPAKPAPPPRADLVGLRDRAVARLADRIEVAARITPAGVLAKLELADRDVAIGVPLVERVADPDVGVAYLGERDAGARVCAIVAHALGVSDLRGYLVIVAPDKPVETLQHALVDGLRDDVDRCLAEQHGVAVIVAPEAGTP